MGVPIRKPRGREKMRKASASHLVQIALWFSIVGIFVALLTIFTLHYVDSKFREAFLGMDRMARLKAYELRTLYCLSNQYKGFLFLSINSSYFIDFKEKGRNRLEECFKDDLVNVEARLVLPPVARATFYPKSELKNNNNNNFKDWKEDLICYVQASALGVLCVKSNIKDDDVKEICDLLRNVDEFSFDVYLNEEAMSIYKINTEGDFEDKLVIPSLNINDYYYSIKDKETLDSCVNALSSVLSNIPSSGANSNNNDLNKKIRDFCNNLIEYDLLPNLRPSLEIRVGLGVR